MRAELAPPETLEALRGIDPDADLVHVEGATWILGVRKPNPEAQERIQRQLQLVDLYKATSYAAGLEFELLQLYAGGFRPIQLYTLGEELEGGEVVTFGWIVEDFRLRDYNWRVREKAAHAEFRDAISLDRGNERRANVFRDFFDAEGKGLWRHVMAKARNFLQPGLHAPEPGRE